MLKKTIILVLTLLPTMLMAQDKDKKETPIDVKGDMFFDAQCYNKALNEYKKAFGKHPEDLRLKRRIAEVILLNESPRGNAINYIDSYLETVTDDVEAYYLAAQAHFHAHEFSKARKFLDNYQTLATDEKDLKKAEQLSEWIENAQTMIKDSLTYVMINLGEGINTPFSEINPLIFDNDRILVFSSDAKYNSQGLVNYFNIMYSENKEMPWTKSKALSGADNTLYDEYVAGLSSKGIYFSSNEAVQFGIYECFYNGNGRFSEGMRLAAPIDMKGNETAATSTITGDTIIFAAENASGKLDLYYSIQHNDLWCTPRLLPGQVNMEDYDENYPRLSRDGKRLYFSSDRPGSMGGMDLYYSDLNPKTFEWGKPVHLKYPINDTYDNLTVSYSSSGRYAYISAIRPDGLGGRDIYAVVFDNVTPSTALIKCYLSIKAKPKALPVTDYPSIKVLDKTGEEVATFMMKLSTSTFVMALDPGVYTLVIESDNTKTYTEDITILEKEYDQQTAIEKVIMLEPNK